MKILQPHRWQGVEAKSAQPLSPVKTNHSRIIYLIRALGARRQKQRAWGWWLHALENLGKLTGSTLDYSLTRSNSLISGHRRNKSSQNSCHARQDAGGQIPPMQGSRKWLFDPRMLVGWSCRCSCQDWAPTALVGA